MKTSVNMVRNLGGFEVSQRSDDSMFNATELLKAWNENAILNHQDSGDLKTKDMEDYKTNKSTKTLVKIIMEELGVDDEEEVMRSRRGRYHGGTYMHPYLFIDFAMWVNPRFRIEVLKFIHDNLIEFRNIAGDDIKLLKSTMNRHFDRSLEVDEYIGLARALNYCVFGTHSKDIRNTAQPADLTNMNNLQRYLISAIKIGEIKSFPLLPEKCRVFWSKRIFMSEERAKELK